jgi:hypothetical protein
VVDVTANRPNVSHQRRRQRRRRRRKRRSRGKEVGLEKEIQLKSGKRQKIYCGVCTEATTSKPSKGKRKLKKLN